MLDVAFKVAEANPIDDLPKMAAVLIDSKGKIVAIGMNRLKSHPLQKRYARNHHSILLHAEIDALRRAVKTHTRAEIAEMSIFVARVNKNGLPCLAKPCKGYEQDLKAFGIKSIVWTED